MVEYYLCRAMEVARLTDEQLARLQAHEKKPRVGREWDTKTQDFKTFEDRIVRCLNPWEIQSCLGLPTLKEHWAIPDNDMALAMHNQRLRNQLRNAEMGGGEKKNLVPLRDFSILGIENVEAVHRFDLEIKRSVISFRFQFGSGKSSSVKDKIKGKIRGKFPKPFGEEEPKNEE